MAKRLAILDPSGRLTAELAPLAKEANVQLVATKVGDPVDRNVTSVLVAPAVAADLGPAPADGPPRWVVGDGSNAARVAGAAAGGGASGVVLTPVSLAALQAVAHADPI